MLPHRIKQLRNEKKLSQAALGEHLNLTQQAIAKWEKGISEPDSENINKLAYLFGVTTDYLLGKESTNSAHEKELPTLRESEALELADALMQIGLLNPKEPLAPQIRLLLKFVESNKDFILALKEK